MTTTAQHDWMCSGTVRDTMLEPLSTGDAVRDIPGIRGALCMVCDTFASVGGTMRNDCKCGWIKAEQDGTFTRGNRCQHPNK